MSQPLISPEVYKQSLQSLAEGPKILVPILTETARLLLSSYLEYILIIILFTALTKILAGRIGSLIYNTIYFGILFVIIAVKGFEILFNPYFDFICLLLYGVSYYLTGRILKKIKPGKYNWI